MTLAMQVHRRTALVIGANLHAGVCPWPSALCLNFAYLNKNLKTTLQCGLDWQYPFVHHISNVRDNQKPLTAPLQPPLPFCRRGT